MADGTRETHLPQGSAGNGAEKNATTTTTTRNEHEKYSVFTVNQKRAIVATGSLASFFSPLSSTIYFPALDTIALALNVSTTKIDLTVTTYLVMQGIAPMLIAGFSDSAGRRPAYLICFGIYLLANLGLALQNSYAALLALRCLQSAGSSGTVALANGMVGDIITPAERGTYVAYASVGSMLGPSLSPVIGGLITQYLDWHWIFWFLLIFSGVFALLLALFLPETCRNVVGDASIRPPTLNMSLTDILRQHHRTQRGDKPNNATQTIPPSSSSKPRKRLPSPLPTLLILGDPETALILLSTGLSFACFYAVMTGATTSFHQIYHFSNLHAAFMYIPIGAGGIISAFTTGRIVDWNFGRHARRANLGPIRRNVRQDLRDFNIERARLEVAMPFFYLGNAAMVAYGWAMGRRLHIAVPVALLFVCGYSVNATIQVLNALMVDLWPGRAAAATAANNLVRCELGAAASAAITPLSERLGRGWAYTLLGGVAVVASGSLWVTMGKGMGWRRKRVRREER